MGRVIHISSIMGFTSIVERIVYYATKSALLSLGRASALDLSQFGITVNCIAPGPFLTELTLTNFAEEARQKFADRTALAALATLRSWPVRCYYWPAKRAATSRVPVWLSTAVRS